MLDNKNDFCFVIMPFKKDFNNQWEFALSPAIEDAGLTPYRGDEESLGSNMIMRDVTQCVYKSKIIIADLSGRNPNVMYELGLAHSAKKPVIMITQTKEDVPFDVQHLRYLKYDPLDLKKLRHELSVRISSTLEQSKENNTDFFPELVLMDEKSITELKYLRQKTVPIEIEVYPPTSDIFFNDKFIGTGNQTLHLNPYAISNTISAAAVEFFEHHQDISERDVESQKIVIVLKPRDRNHLMQRVPNYLKYRRRDPNNPVLMRAIAQFLFQIDELDEAFIETKELLHIAPNWFLAHYLYAHLLILQNNFPEAIKHYKNCISLRPDHAIGYIGLSCAMSLHGDHKSAINQLEKILESETTIQSYHNLGNWNIRDEGDFMPLRESKKYKDIFENIIEKLEKR